MRNWPSGSADATEGCTQSSQLSELKIVSGAAVSEAPLGSE
jgi:hypothetical protein